MELQQTVVEKITPPLTAARSWPDAFAFREAIQRGGALADPVLQAARVLVDRRGLPLTYSGRFAVVFRLSARGSEEWALRCFTQPIDTGERGERYDAFAVRAARLPGRFVPFAYNARGICVGGDWFPAVAMRWAGGEPLGRFVERRVRQPLALRTLCQTLGKLLSDLETAGIAHGDWQHDNLLVSEEGRTVTLVDYDGAFVPELAGRTSPERGHPNYQHPQRDTADFAEGLDRFAHLVMQTALPALAREPALWARFSDGESLLFKRADLADPARSPVFAAVRACGRGDTILSSCLARLEAACCAGKAGVFLPEAGANAAVLPANRKWWVTTEAARKGTVSSATAALPPSSDAFISQLELPETRRQEQNNLWAARICWFLSLTVLVVLALFAPRYLVATWPFIPLVWLPYFLWSRLDIRGKLRAEIEAMNKLIEGRKAMIAERRTKVSVNPGRGSLEEFVSARLRNTPINGVLSVPGVTVSTLEQLHFERVYSAADLVSPLDLPDVPFAQVALLHQWRTQIEQAAEDQYHRAGCTTGVQAELARLDGEIAAFEAERDKLCAERDRFPSASLGAYVGKVIGLKDKRPPFPKAANNS